MGFQKTRKLANQMEKNQEQRHQTSLNDSQNVTKTISSEIHLEVCVISFEGRAGEIILIPISECWENAIIYKIGTMKKKTG